MPLTPSNLNVTVSTSAQPPHFSSLIGKSLSLDKHHNVVVEEVLAEGGFGVIFLVKNSNDKVKYALKRVVVNNEKDYESVVGEVGVMSTFSPKTPHILSSITHLIVSYPQTSTHELCNLMPLCSKNLLQIASTRMQKQSSFTNEEILQVLHSVCSGLHYLHNSTPPILHRDIKIENILLQDESYVLSDFGSATTKVWDPSVDSVQVINEDLDKHTTLLYRSPEMVDLYGGRGAIGVASDVWALGVTGYKLMTFKDPFESILAIQNRNLSWGQGVKSKFNEFIVSLVECCLAENQTVRPIVEEVQGICAGGLTGDWNGLHTCVQRITDNLKSLKEEEVNRQKVNSNNNPVVMETTVTPRQRPKRGAGGGSSGAAAVTTDGVIPVLAAPPKSPKPVSPCNNSSVVGGGGFFGPPTSSQSASQSTTPLLQQQQTISPSSSLPITQSLSATPSPTPPQQQQPTTTTHSWNPFDEDYVVVPPAASSAHCDNNDTQDNANDKKADDEDDDDPFAKAPFDYFKYQPIIPGNNNPSVSSYDQPAYYLNHEHTQQQQSSFFYYAPNNPFLNYYDEDGGGSSSLMTQVQQMQQHSMMMNTMMGGGSGIAAGVCNLSFDDGHLLSGGGGGGGERLFNNGSSSSDGDSQQQQQQSQQEIVNNNSVLNNNVGGGSGGVT